MFCTSIRHESLLPALPHSSRCNIVYFQLSRPGTNFSPNKPVFKRSHPSKTNLRLGRFQCFLRITERISVADICIYCYAPLSNHTKRSCHRIRQYEYKPKTLKNKSMEFFSQRKKSKQKIDSLLKLKNKLLHHSYNISFKIAKIGNV